MNLGPKQQTATGMSPTEKRTVPALEHILGALTSRLPQQNLPSTEVCGLISNI